MRVRAFAAPALSAAIVWIALDLTLGTNDRGALATIGIALAGALAAMLVAAFVGPGAAWRRLTGIADAASRVAGGDLAARAPDDDDEDLGALGSAINRIAGELSTSAEATRKERDLLSAILEGMNEGVLVLDRNGRIVLANPAAVAMTVAGDDPAGRAVIEAIRNATLAQAIARVLAGKPGDLVEVETGGAQSRRLLVRIETLKGKGGQGGVVAVLHDVTDLRRLETIRTDFVANVSHELRTPVSAISMAAETLLAGALHDSEEAPELVHMVERHARRLRTLVDDLLDLSKIEGKAYRLSPVATPLLPAMEQAAAMALDAARRRKMTIRVSAEKGAAASVDGGALDQVLGNLLDNAVKYAGEGAEISLSATVSNGQTLLAVSDTGIGIASQHLDRIFERFYRVDAGRSREVGGTGLGLSIVKHLVEAMGGQISVKSTLGGGTTFTLAFPAP